MNLNQLRSQILVNRRLLSGMYVGLAEAKADKRFYDEQDEMLGEYEAHNYLKWLRKQILNLVTLQKALKRDLADTIIVARIDRWAESVEGKAWIAAKGEVEREAMAAMSALTQQAQEFKMGYE